LLVKFPRENDPTRRRHARKKRRARPKYGNAKIFGTGGNRGRARGLGDRKVAKGNRTYN
jgi:hypothetical protein